MIRVSSPALLGNEKKYVNDALDKGDIALGEYTPRFEKHWADYVGTKHSLSCSSGTSALILALRAVKLQPGDSVIIPALTYIATANAVRYFGAEVIPVDVDESWNINPYLISDALKPSTKAVIAVHLYGRPAAMDLIKAAAGHRRRVIEDAAEAHGAVYKGKRVGSIGDLGCFSFYGNKIITTGEGGMVTTDSDYFASRVQDYRDGFTRGERYHHSDVGFNFRMSNLTAAFGLGQAEQLQQHLDRRESVHQWYRDMLPLDMGITLQQEYLESVTAHWMTSIVLDRRYNRDAVMQDLHEAGVETRPFFPSISDQEPYRSASICINARNISSQGINLPTHVGMEFKMVERVCDSLAKALKAQEGSRAA